MSLLSFKSALRDHQIKRLESKVRSVGVPAAIKSDFRKKPWYLSSADHHEVQTRALLIILSEDRRFPLSGDVTQARFYKLLSQERPDSLSLEKWKKVLDEATTALEASVLYQLQFVYEREDTLKLCALKRPQFFPEDRWQELREKMGEAAVRVLTKHVKYFEQTAIDILKQNKPEGLEDDWWEQIRKLAKEALVYKVEHEMRRAENPLKS